MIDPWDLKLDNERIADSLPTFIIFCEDQISEPIYFKYFETSKIKVNPIQNQKNMMSNVLNAICHCTENKLFAESENSTCCFNEGIQIWCVFDRDKEETDEKRKRGNVEFDESIRTAISRGINLAYSNDAFELWILLHFEDIIVNEENKHRLKYYERLTEIFKSISSPNEDLIRAIQYSGFTYKNSLKSENNFRNIVRSEIVGKTSQAIERAKELEKNYLNNQITDHEKEPYTRVHHLVEELIRLGQKEI